MYYSCKHCGRMHRVGERCPSKPTRQTKGDRQADKFRSTAAWQRKREEIKPRDRYVCRVCLDNGQLNYGDLEVHHIVPLEEAFDKRLDDSNLITLCVTHHKMAERGELSRERLVALASIPPGLLDSKNREGGNTTRPPQNTRISQNGKTEGREGGM